MITKIKVENIIFLFLGFISVQRFLMPNIYSSLPILILIGFSCLNFLSNKKIYSLSILVSSLILITDVGGEDGYSLTPSFLIFLLFLFLLVNYISLNPSLSFKSNLINLITFLPIFPTIIGFNTADFIFDNYLKDIFIFLSIVYFNFSEKVFIKYNTLEIVKIISRLLLFTSLGILFGEILNILFFYKPWNDWPHYLSYSTARIWGAYPFVFFYFKFRRKLFSFLFILICIFYSSQLSSRNIPIFFGIFLTIDLIICNFENILINLKKLFFQCKFKINIPLFITIIISTLLLIFSITRFIDLIEKSRVLNTILVLISSDPDNLMNAIKLLDPVRFFEWENIFNMSLGSTIFGHGIGSTMDISPIIDQNINCDTGAYTCNEVAKELGYRLKDFFTYYLYKFGLPFFSIVFFKVLIMAYKNNGKDDFEASSLSFMLLINFVFAFYSLDAWIISLSIFTLLKNYQTQKRTI